MATLRLRPAGAPAWSNRDSALRSGRGLRVVLNTGGPARFAGASVGCRILSDGWVDTQVAGFELVALGTSAGSQWLGAAPSWIPFP